MTVSELIDSPVQGISRGLIRDSLNAAPALDLLSQRSLINYTPQLDGLIRGEQPGAGTFRLKQPGRCVYLDGVDSYITWGNTTAAVKSISLWVKPDDITSHTDYLIDLNGTDYITIVNGEVTANGFSGATVTIYVDGVEDATIPNISEFHHVLITSDTGFTASDVELGRLSGTGFYAGYAFDLRLSTAELTATHASHLATLTSDALQNDSFALHAKLDDRHPTIAYDSSGNDRHGTKTTWNVSANHYEGSDVPFSWQNDKGFSEYLHWNGSQKIDISGLNAVISKSLDYTVSLRVTPDNVSGIKGLFQYALGAADRNGIVINNAQVQAGYYNGSGYVGHVANAAVAGKELHIAYKNVGGIVTLYIDGVATSAGTGVGNFGAADKTLGYTSNGPGYLSGFMRDVRIWNRGLSDAEVLSVYGGSSVASGLVRSYAIDSGNAFLEDASSSDAHLYTTQTWYRIPRLESAKTTDVFEQTLQYTGECPSNQTLIESNCGTFDGTDDWVDCGAFPELEGVSACTFSMWFRRFAAGQPVNFVKSGITNHLLGIDVHPSGNVYFYTANGSLSYGYFASNDTDWHHVVGVFDGSQTGNARLRMYLDGVEKTLTYSGTQPATTSTSLDNLHIGKMVYGSTTYSKGYVAGCRVFLDALTASEVLSEYNRTGATLDNCAGYWPFSEGGESTNIADVVAGNDGTATSIATGTFWGTKQSVFFYNGAYGCSRYTHATTGTIYVPYDLDGTPHSFTPPSGYSLENDCPAGSWHNGCESGIDLTGGVAYPGSSGVTTDYEFGDVLTNPEFCRYTTKSGVNYRADRFLRYIEELSGAKLTAAQAYTATQAIP